MQTMIEFCLGHISEGAYNIKDSILKAHSLCGVSGVALLIPTDKQLK